jgi:hypothetical protein
MRAAQLTPMFGIWAEVWGGVTGHRCGWLKAATFDNLSPTSPKCAADRRYASASTGPD